MTDQCVCDHVLGIHLRAGHGWLCLGTPTSPAMACACDDCDAAVREGGAQLCRCHVFRAVASGPTLPPAPAGAPT